MTKTYDLRSEYDKLVEVIETAIITGQITYIQYSEK